jgi:hypothetical protein
MYKIKIYFDEKIIRQISINSITISNFLQHNVVFESRLLFQIFKLIRLVFFRCLLQKKLFMVHPGLAHLGF